jgi:hypothetical protein
MFVRVLSPTIHKNLALVAKTSLAAQFYLAGGTAVALHLDHRRSYDLDFFIPEQDFSLDLPCRELAHLGELVILQESAGSFVGMLDGAQISFFIYPYPLLDTPVDFEGVRVAGLPDLAAMKLEAISSRGKKRDFIDLYRICQDAFPLRQVIENFERKYAGVRYSLVHLLKSLTYFDDAEPDPMPSMLVSLEWDQVKRFFEEEIRRLTKEFAAASCLLTSGECK